PAPRPIARAALRRPPPLLPPPPSPPDPAVVVARQAPAGHGSGNDVVPSVTVLRLCVAASGGPPAVRCKDADAGPPDAA
ncbi:unnamed protein product, partial [Urochloa humidicola]